MRRGEAYALGEVYRTLRDIPFLLYGYMSSSLDFRLLILGEVSTDLGEISSIPKHIQRYLPDLHLVVLGEVPPH